eukprot:TRINITY_DN11547_c0_g2_i2.p1 TRINITY_DN11547_c0_g2~~TRINITY_DN11547_c0_g2_i2.p1  ORF type:complete len:280 (+),score=54.70 TRINITY_DN11547_c0_g2_i2:275-1114(+)
MLQQKQKDPATEQPLSGSPKQVVASAVSRSVEALKEAKPLKVPLEVDEEDEEDFLPGLPDFSALGGRGVGRGRPMAGLQQFDPMGLHGRGMGRGRALAPPPGLQSLQFATSSKLPQTLSRPWKPEAIPEDEDVQTPLLGYASGAEGLGSWMLPPDIELPNAALQRDSENSESGLGVFNQTPSHWSQAQSYVPTPTQKWSKTPSPPGTPLNLPGAASGSFAFAAHAAASGLDPQLLQSMAQGMIPYYVTVPIAMAQCCPHCHKHFALPPEGTLPAPEAAS